MFFHFRCVFDMRTSLGVIMSNVNGILIILVFFACAVSYIAIFIRVKTSALMSMENLISKQRRMKINRSGRIMMIFVLAFLVQWWAWAVQCIWAFFEFPALWMIVATVAFTNSGGVLNAFAYTIMRRRHATSGERGSRSHFVLSTISSGSAIDNGTTNDNI